MEYLCVTVPAILSGICYEYLKYGMGVTGIHDMSATVPGRLYECDRTWKVV